MSPSRLSSPTVAEAATMLWMAIVFPPAPPAAWAAVVISGETLMVFAVDHWNCENVRFETVFEPATNAPRAPMNGAKNGQAPPVRSEEHTSELQSRGHLVCRLLLEKKKYKS